jgi:Arc/MetJ-type ribon-helix-helix transcriptional regulator
VQSRFQVEHGVATPSYSWYAIGMKISVSLPEEDVEFLDQYAESQGYGSRSAVVHTAVRMLRSSKLGGAYEDAWREWADSGESEVWDSAVGDGFS